MKMEWFKTIIDQLSDGAVVMDRMRVIHYINAMALEMTGWKIGERVPYCSYCQLRKSFGGEERCILAQDNPLPVFLRFLMTWL